MRTPPPVLPPSGAEESGYRTTLFDRVGADAGLRVRIAGFGVMVFAITMLAGMLVMAQAGSRGGGGGMLGLVAMAFVFGGLAMLGAMKFAGGAGAVMKAVTLPSGASTPYEEQFSYQESLAARGDVAGALESYEAVIAERPGAVAPRMKAAEHYAKNNRNPVRAAELFREVRDTAGATARDVMYASSRLVDLYQGPMNDPGRAVVELRRIIERFPGSRMAEEARTAMPGLKRRLHGGTE